MQQSQHIKKSNLFRKEVQESHQFDDLDVVQFGWDFKVAQLGPCHSHSNARLYQTRHVGLNRFRYDPAYDQRLRSRSGFLSFGLLDIDNPATWAYDQLIPNDALTVFPHDEYLRGSSPAGFRGSGIHLDRNFLEGLAQIVYRRPLKDIVPPAGIYMPNPDGLTILREEILKWEQLEAFGASVRPSMVSRREETLGLAVLDALADQLDEGSDQSIKTGPAMARALEFIHGSELETVSAADLCRHAQCSQRTLEKNFQKRFGVTPKKYIKCLRLARVHHGLRNFDAQDFDSIIELAGIQGFWHMGQFAADYRRIYGELPSDTIKNTSCA